MKHSLTTIVLLAASLALGGCVDDYGGRYGGVYSAGAYPYGGGYYDGYPAGGYYRGNSYYRGPERAYRHNSYRDRAYRSAPRTHWDYGHRDDRTVRDSAGRDNDANRSNWSRNPVRSGGRNRWNGQR